jgi:hypothetical protein
MSRPLSTFSLRRIVAAGLLAGGLAMAAPAAQAEIFGYSGGPTATVYLTLNYSNGTSVTLSSLTNPAHINGYATIGSYDSTGYHAYSNTNYEAEVAGVGGSLGYNNFFIFNLSSVASHAGTLDSASMSLNTFDDQHYYNYTLGSYSLGNDATDLPADVLKLEKGGTGLTNIYSALGAGVADSSKAYGSAKYSPADSYIYETITLNEAFIKEVENVITKKYYNIVLGGEATTATPEPATWALMMIGLGGVGAAMRRARRRAGEARA